MRYKNKVVCWGAGSELHRALETLLLKIDYIVDKNPKKWGAEIEGIPFFFT